jgi:hypothetical protein
LFDTNYSIELLHLLGGFRVSTLTKEYRIEHRGKTATIFQKGSHTPIAIAKAPRVGRDVWIEDVKGQVFIQAKHRAAYKFDILDNNGQLLAELKRALISKDFTLYFKEHEIKPHNGIGKNGFEAYDAQGNLAFSLQRHPKEKKAVWLVSVGNITDSWVALCCAYAIGRVCFTHLSENRGFSLSSFGEIFADPACCCCGCPLTILIIILALSGMLGGFTQFFEWLFGIIP